MPDIGEWLATKYAILQQQANAASQEAAANAAYRTAQTGEVHPDALANRGLVTAQTGLTGAQTGLTAEQAKYVGLTARANAAQSYGSAAQGYASGRLDDAMRITPTQFYPIARQMNYQSDGSMDNVGAAPITNITPLGTGIVPRPRRRPPVYTSGTGLATPSTPPVGSGLSVLDDFAKRNSSFRTYSAP